MSQLSSHSHYHAIPTNIITGFLGVGKTTAIQHLLATKPTDQRWAVLVNEFGEVGIDGSLLRNQATGVAIKEVPGGCLCCAAGVPLQVALNQLIQQANPQRLLIEPTGLGHPHEVINTFTQPPYQTVLDLRATLTLVDARNLDNRRYIEHPIFNQQLQVADILIAHKSDQASEAVIAQLHAYLQQIDLATTPLYQVAHGQLDPNWLDMPRQAVFPLLHTHHHTVPDLADPPPITFPACGYLHKTHAEDGFMSQGWIFAPHHVFVYQSLHALFTQLSILRLKAVMVTEQGVMAFNKVADSLTCTPLPDAQDSRIECIDVETHRWEDLEPHLLKCLRAVG